MTQQTPRGKGIAKRWLIGTTFVAVFALLAGALAWRSLDPVVLKTKIIAAVMQETGLTLSIADDIVLSLLPPSIDLGGVELENAPGFSAAFLVRSDTLAVRIKLLPLLRKQIDMQTLTVKGLELNLERDRYGRTKLGQADCAHALGRDAPVSRSPRGWGCQYPECFVELCRPASPNPVHLA